VTTACSRRVLMALMVVALGLGALPSAGPSLWLTNSRTRMSFGWLKSCCVTLRA